MTVTDLPLPADQRRPSAPETQLRRRRPVSHWLQPTIVVLLVVALLGVPFWMVVVTAGKDQAEALNPNLSLPSHWQLLENFGTVLTQGRMVPAFLGSMLVMVPSVLGVLILGSMASWVLARRKSRLISVVYALGISGIVLPPAVVTIVLLLRQLGLAGTAVGMIGVYMGMYLSTVIFFVTGFVRTIPVELEEAARVDGAGPVRVFARIILPLLGPTLATATILICLYIWNDVFYALFVVGGRLDTLPLNLYQVASSGLYLQNWHLIFAYVILMSLPLLLTFVVMQRKIIAGITSGAVK
ncbi:MULTISPECIES: carbohydrate ABC transporter permease [unclassified Curtobacterium]|uniref:carbohydrate ABC transporter permease n=1 Tax=unclassified Curtobacterium TaxID=257496 RepID=UPI000DAA595C|nr:MULTISPECIES: carbohydrate ABC transporter permease [unclassified Curtobacterium]NQX24756.1 carbohydrate ABC transporter permease [Curtobacterium sp. VKM Ac-2852]WIE57171.1 carbohydrate ABC transporter permease [Curtobacterium sp. MCLR17_031]